MIGTTLAMLAHQGGWDEILMVAGPIAIIMGLLAIVRRRLDAGLSDDGRTPDSVANPETNPVTNPVTDPVTDSEIG